MNDKVRIFVAFVPKKMYSKGTKATKDVLIKKFIYLIKELKKSQN